MASLIGNKPNQVPTNGDLGTMAFREADQFVPTSGIGSTVQAYSAQLQSYATNGVAMKNRIINGAMVIDQRNAGASVTANDGVYPVDRFKFNSTLSSKATAQRSTTAPAGFINSLLVTSSSSYSVASGDAMSLVQVVEGFNVGDLNWGTANAKTVTLSFQVRSSLTGSFGGAIQNVSSNRSYPFTYSIPVANTWTNVSVTIAGDTTGTWATDNTQGMRIHFNIGTGTTYSGTAGSWAGANYISAIGAVNIIATSGATFYITGVQLEVGSSATGFEYRQYQQELQLCQRYYETVASNSMIWSGNSVSGNNFYYGIPYKVTKRANPTVVVTSSDTGAGFPSTASSTAGTPNTDVARLTRVANGTSNATYFADSITASAEL